MMSDKDCIDFDNYLDDLKSGIREIKVDNYIKYQITSVENGHDIKIITGDETAVTLPPIT